jgi:sec-independent protein translocase protein TatB
MFDIGWSELMLIGIVALVVIGPKDLPGAIYGVGKWVRKARVVAREFQGHIDDMMRESELDDLRKQALKARDLHMSRMVEDVVDPKGEMKAAFDLPQSPILPTPSAEAPPTPTIEAPPTPAEEPPAVPPATPADAPPPSTPEKSA